MAKKRKEIKGKPVEVIPIRDEEYSRIYANFVRVVRMQEGEVSLQFCDVKPPPSDIEAKNIREKGQIEAPIICEIVLQENVAKGFLSALMSQIEKGEGK